MSQDYSDGTAAAKQAPGYLNSGAEGMHQQQHPHYGHGGAANQHTGGAQQPQSPTATAYAVSSRDHSGSFDGGNSNMKTSPPRQPYPDGDTNKQSQQPVVAAAAQEARAPSVPSPQRQGNNKTPLAGAASLPPMASPPRTAASAAYSEGASTYKQGETTSPQQQPGNAAQRGATGPNIHSRYPPRYPGPYGHPSSSPQQQHHSSAYRAGGGGNDYPPPQAPPSYHHYHHYQDHPPPHPPPHYHSHTAPAPWQRPPPHSSGPPPPGYPVPPPPSAAPYGPPVGAGGHHDYWNHSRDPRYPPPPPPGHAPPPPPHSYHSPYPPTSSSTTHAAYKKKENIGAACSTGRTTKDASTSGGPASSTPKNVIPKTNNNTTTTNSAASAGTENGGASAASSPKKDQPKGKSSSMAEDNEKDVAVDDTTGSTNPGDNGEDQYNSNENEVDGRRGATSPSQIESTRMDEVQHMGCTCKKTRCLKLYCQCFGVKLYCGSNCRCVQCFNLKRFDKQRREAMRSILQRNPGAFDTKFKKPGVEIEVAKNARSLAHKVGCKCRKSACMKKYCECYAGNVKCSASCRCMGCKNMGATYFQGDRDAEGNLLEPANSKHQHASPVAQQQQLAQQPHHPYSVPPPAHPHHYMSAHHPAPYAHHHHPVSTSSSPPRRGSAASNGAEPWLAAQNLTFLKRGSPSSQSEATESATKKPRKTSDRYHAQESASMPSLASSSGETFGTSSPGGTLCGSKRDNHSDDSNSGTAAAGVSSLLMAAYAMTEFAGDAASSGGTDKKKKKSKKGGKSPKKQQQDGGKPPRKMAPSPPVATAAV